MRFAGTCYRAHDPRWSFKPLSGDGAAIRGARFNPKGVPALYLALGIMTAVKEISQGLAHRLDPCVLCSYDVDCEDIIDLSDDAGRKAASVTLDEMSAPWAFDLATGKRPASWSIHDRLFASGAAGILVPSFAPGADEGDRNLVLWDHPAPGPPWRPLCRY
ncbi:MAG: RES domain-containing protein [Devosia sp.]|nr:RES domain-containing protein [Devosia sp.]